MSRRSLRALGEIVVVVVVTGLLVGGQPSQASEPDPPATSAQPAPIVVTARASKPNHFNSKIDVNLPPGTTASVTSPTLGEENVIQISTYAPLSDYAVFEELAQMLLRQPTPRHRLLACVTKVTSSIVEERARAELRSELADFDATAGSLLEARMVYCMRVAFLIAEVQAEMAAGQRTVARAGTRCGDLPVGVKEKVTRSEGSYTVTGKPPTIKKKNAGVKVKCTFKDSRMTMKIKAPKGKTLRQILGPNVKFGLASPSSASGTVPLTVAFKAL